MDFRASSQRWGKEMQGFLPDFLSLRASERFSINNQGSALYFKPLTCHLLLLLSCTVGTSILCLDGQEKDLSVSPRSCPSVSTRLFCPDIPEQVGYGSQDTCGCVCVWLSVSVCGDYTLMAGKSLFPILPESPQHYLTFFTSSTERLNASDLFDLTRICNK